MTSTITPRRRFLRYMLLILALAAVIWAGLRVMAALGDHNDDSPVSMAEADASQGDKLAAVKAGPMVTSEAGF